MVKVLPDTRRVVFDDERVFAHEGVTLGALLAGRLGSRHCSTGLLRSSGHADMCLGDQTAGAKTYCWRRGPDMLRA